jgi:TPR repeat protein
MPGIRFQLAGLCALSLALSAGAYPQASAPVQRGFAQPSADDTQVRHGHHYIVAIGIDHYQNWPVLFTAVSDATGFAKLLTTNFGFELAAEPLTEEKATREHIVSLIDDELRAKLKSEDDLIIFFAGHGTTRTDKVGDTTQSVGFIVPVDAHGQSKNEHWSDYLNTEEFLRTVSTLPSSHILVILDSCHSGMALGRKFSSSRGDTRLQQDLLRSVSRKVIASAQGNQMAADQGPLPGHSLFTGLMIQGLTTGKADTFEQGFITASQLGAFTQHAVGLQEGSRQTPLFGSFDLDDGGELIIPLGTGAAPPPAPALAPAPHKTSLAAKETPAPPPSDAVPNLPTASKQQLTFSRLENNELARMRDVHLFYWQDDNPLKDFPAARSAALKLCDNQDGWGCAEASYSFRYGLGGDRDDARALSLAKQACDLKEPEGCVSLGVLTELGRGIAPDPLRAFQLYQDACARKNPRGCFRVAMSYRSGHGVSQDLAKSASILRSVCDQGNLVSCDYLALMYVQGQGVPKDGDKASSYYRKGCDGGQMSSCSSLGLLYTRGVVVKKDDVQALSLFRKACSAADTEGCNQVGIAYANGLGVSQDLQQAALYYRRACDIGGGILGCNNLGNMYVSGQGVERDFAKAISLFRQACDVGQMAGCTNLAVMYEKGQGIEKDNAQALALLEKSCGAGHPLGCKDLGEMYRNGVGVPRNPAQAASFLQKACSGGNAEACEELKSPR